MCPFADLDKKPEVTISPEWGHPLLLEKQLRGYLDGGHTDRKPACLWARTDIPPSARLTPPGPLACVPNTLNKGRGVCVKQELANMHDLVERVINQPGRGEIGLECLSSGFWSSACVPGIIHGCASIDVWRSRVSSVHHKQLSLQDLTCFSSHVQRSGAFLLQSVWWREREHELTATAPQATELILVFVSIREKPDGISF